MIKITKHALAPLAAVATIACTSAVAIHTLRAPDATFARYRTVSVAMSSGAPADFEASLESPKVRAYVSIAATGVLERKGYAIVHDQPSDLVLRVESGRREQMVSNPAPTQIGLSPDVPNTVPDYVPVVQPYHGYLDEEQRELHEGAFVIDAFDGKNHELVWHGFAETEVRPGAIDYDRLRRAVRSVMASFPAAGSK